MIFERMPNVSSNVERKSGVSDKGGDLICEFDTGMEFLGIQRVERCAIQVKSYVNEMDYDRAVRDIENVFKAEKDIPTVYSSLQLIKSVMVFKRNWIFLRAKQVK